MERYTKAQFTSIVALLITEVVLYILTLLFMAYITYWFLYRQQKYRIYFISSFYTLSGALVFLRLVLTILVLVFTEQYDATWQFNTEPKAKMLLAVLCIEAFATYFKVSIGLLLAAAIFLLTK